MGHEGHTLAMKIVEEVDEVVVHRAERCRCCGRLFGELEPEHLLYRRQVFDIPEPKLEITEHQVVGKRSLCRSVLSMAQRGLCSNTVLCATTRKLHQNTFTQLCNLLKGKKNISYRYLNSYKNFIHYL
jgi:hypothetical protein